jgi:hypothetical protein
MQQLILIITALMLTSCSVNQGFPREINGKLKPINSQEITSHVR